MKSVLILGGGFAGIESAIDLCKSGFDVTLVSDRDYFYIYPISIWIPTQEIDFNDATLPLNQLAMRHGFHLKIGSVVDIEASENRITLETQESLSYDYLIVAMGAHKLQPKGVEHTFSICGAPEEAQKLQTHLEALMKKGSGKLAFGFAGNPNDTTGIRGGPGFELMFNVHNLLKKRGLRDAFDITFFAPMKEPGKRMGEKSMAMMDKMFSMTNINRKVGTKITHFTPDGICFEDGEVLQSDLTMFIPATTGHRHLANSDLPLTSSGFIKIDDFGCIEGFDNAYAIGDCAAIEGPAWRAKQGHIAEVMARNAAFNIHAIEKGIKERKGYQEHLNILCVMDTGNGAAFVYRDNKRSMMIPMPIVGHWMKKAWGHYCKLSKMGRIPRFL